MTKEAEDYVKTKELLEQSIANNIAHHAEEQRLNAELTLLRKRDEEARRLLTDAAFEFRKDGRPVRAFRIESFLSAQKEGA